MSEGKQLPPAAVVVTFEVEDWDQWKAAFDSHEETRKANGILGHHINRARTNPDEVAIYLAVGDEEKAKAFYASPELRELMKGSGVRGRPQLNWMTPVSENIVWDRELPAVMVTHPVADFDAFLAVYQGADAIRQAGGIIGHAVNRADAGVAIIYHQAESFDALDAFKASPELKAAMETAGVTAPPYFTFYTGGWARQY